MFVCCECCVLSGRGLCDGLITRPGESYRLWCVVVCDQETSTRRKRPWPALGCSAIRNINLGCFRAGKRFSPADTCWHVAALCSKLCLRKLKNATLFTDLMEEGSDEMSVRNEYWERRKRVKDRDKNWIISCPISAGILHLHRKYVEDPTELTVETQDRVCTYSSVLHIVSAT